MWRAGLRIAYQCLSNFFHHTISSDCKHCRVRTSEDFVEYLELPLCNPYCLHSQPEDKRFKERETQGLVWKKKQKEHCDLWKPIGSVLDISLMKDWECFEQQQQQKKTLLKQNPVEVVRDWSWWGHFSRLFFSHFLFRFLFLCFSTC